MPDSSHTPQAHDALRQHHDRMHGLCVHGELRGQCDRFGPTANAIREVHAERRRQEAKWGQQNHPDGTGPDLIPGAIERRDAWRRKCDRMHRSGKGTWEHILTEEYAEALACTDPAELRAELIQIAAVAVAWVEAIDRRAEPPQGADA